MSSFVRHLVAVDRLRRVYCAELKEAIECHPSFSVAVVLSSQQKLVESLGNCGESECC